MKSEAYNYEALQDFVDKLEYQILLDQIMLRANKGRNSFNNVGTSSLEQNTLNTFNASKTGVRLFDTSGVA